MSGTTDTGRRILTSAMDLFSERGYKTTTTREIASRAGVNELTLFRHFGSKERLLEASIDAAFDYEELRSTLPPLTGILESDLTALVVFMRESMRSRAPLYRLLLREHSTNGTVREKLKQLPAMVKTVMLDRMRSILKAGKRKEVDMETASVFLMSYFLRSEIMVAMMGEDPFHRVDGERTREAVDIFLHGVLKGA